MDSWEAKNEWGSLATWNTVEYAEKRRSIIQRDMRYKEKTRILTDGRELHDDMEVFAIVQQINIERCGVYSRMGGSCMTTWMCLRGGDEKCSDNSSTGFNLMQPAISPGIWTCPSLTSSSEEGMGVDSFSNIRCHQPCIRKTCPPSRDWEHQHWCLQMNASSPSLSLPSNCSWSHSPQS